MTPRQKERADAKHALQQAKYLCIGYMNLYHIEQEDEWERRFDELARDLGLGKLEQ